MLARFGAIRYGVLRHFHPAAFACVSKECNRIVRDEQPPTRTRIVPFPKRAMIGGYPAFLIDKALPDPFFDANLAPWWSYDPVGDVLATRTSHTEVTVWLARAPDGSRRTTVIDLAATTASLEHNTGGFATELLADGRVLSVLSLDIQHVFFCDTRDAGRVINHFSFAVRDHVFGDSFMYTSPDGAFACVCDDTKHEDDVDVIVSVIDPTPPTTAALHVRWQWSVMRVLDGGTSVITCALLHDSVDLTHNGVSWQLKFIDVFTMFSPSSIRIKTLDARPSGTGGFVARIALTCVEHDQDNAIVSWTIDANRAVSPPSPVRFVGRFHDMVGDLAAYTLDGSLHVLDLASPAKPPLVFKKCAYFPMRVDLARRVVVVADACDRELHVCPIILQ